MWGLAGKNICMPLKNAALNQFIWNRACPAGQGSFPFVGTRGEGNKTFSWTFTR